MAWRRGTRIEAGGSDHRHARGPKGAVRRNTRGRGGRSGLDSARWPRPIAREIIAPPPSFPGLPPRPRGGSRRRAPRGRTRGQRLERVADDPIRIAALARDAEAAARVRHLNVVPVDGLETAGGAIAVVEPHRPGASLRDLLDAGGRLRRTSPRASSPTRARGSLASTPSIPATAPPRARRDHGGAARARGGRRDGPLRPRRGPRRRARRGRARARGGPARVPGRRASRGAGTSARRSGPAPRARRGGRSRARRDGGQPPARPPSSARPWPPRPRSRRERRSPRTSRRSCPSPGRGSAPLTSAFVARATGGGRAGGSRGRAGGGG